MHCGNWSKMGNKIDVLNGTLSRAVQITLLFNENSKVLINKQFTPR